MDPCEDIGRRDGQGVPHPPDVEILCALAGAASFKCQVSHPLPRDLQRFRVVLPALMQYIAARPVSRRVYAVKDLSLDAHFLMTEEQGNQHILAWENYLAARLSVMAYRMASALKQNRLLQGLGATRPTWSDIVPAGSATRRERKQHAWLQEVGDAEPHTAFSTAIFRRFIGPIARDQSAREIIARPGQHGVSFILYGPPGSGKTHAMERLAAFLGWPLISLSPANFMRGGAEKMEANATRVFRALLQLDECVVFFDECDELFRSRKEQSANYRTSLSFATASMLPKLQAIAKMRRVIFAMATNYLHHVDDAVRREGRFDERLLVDRPHTAERLNSIHRYITKRCKEVAGDRLDGSNPAAGEAAASIAAPGTLDASARNTFNEVIAIATLILLRETQGFSFSQIREYCDNWWRVILEPSLAQAFARGGSGLAENLDELHRRLLGLSSPPAQDRERSPADETLAGSLADTWPDSFERHSLGLIGPPGDASQANSLGQTLQRIGALNSHQPSPPPWPKRQVIDYLEWIVSRADLELEAASIDPVTEVLLKSRWVAVPGFHTYFRQWSARGARYGGRPDA